MDYASIAATGIGTVGGLIGLNKSYKLQKQAMQRLQQMSDEAYKIAKDSGDEYAAYLEDLNTNFDMYDVEEAYGHMEQAIIAPMERDFQENMLPQIEAAYGGGLFGEGQGNQAAKAETIARAGRGMAETKAGLRAQEREQAITRNLIDYERRADIGRENYNIGTNLANIRMGQAGTQYNAGTDRAATLAAASSAATNLLTNATSQISQSVDSIMGKRKANQGVN